MSLSQPSAAAAALQSDESLVWSLREFEDHQRALNFVQHFRESLCVYSGKVEQLYARYQVRLPEASDDELVVLPELDEFTETWYFIPERAVRNTHYTIVPGAVVGASGLYLHVPFNERGRGRAVPLATGLRVVADEYTERGEDFLPILTKGDLKAFRRSAPMLQLHRLDLSRMRGKSSFELAEIRRAILGKLRHVLGAGAPVEPTQVS